MSTRGSVPVGLELGQMQGRSAEQEAWSEQHAPAGFERAAERNIVQFGPYAPPPLPREMNSDAVHPRSGRYAPPQLQPYGSASAYAAEASEDPWYAEAEGAWNSAEAEFPQAEALQHSSLDRPLEPLSERLSRLNTASGLELVHSEMLDRYAEAEAEQGEDIETDWYASRIAGARSWASMENSLDTLISDYEKRHHQANVYVAGGIGGAIVLTLIALSAFLTLAG